MLLSELGRRIRERRERRGLRQQDVAAALQVSPQAVSKWERGENGPDVTTLGALATLLGVSTDWLIGVSGARDTFEATVLASSVQGAYKRSLELSARDYTAWVNGFFYPLTETVLRHDGVPVKYVGDGFLCFFSGPEHERRALRAAELALRTLDDALLIGLSSGEIYLGSVGHPDYARPDIMGEVVNRAFLVLEWAQGKAESRLAATGALTEALPGELRLGKSEKVRFRGHKRLVPVFEITGFSESPAA